MNKPLRLWLFRLIAISLPVVFFVLLEAGLRLAGYGKTVPLFIANPAAPDYLLPRPDVVKRYFADEKLAPNVSIETNFFLKQKPADGIRIFVQGGSTAAGFPYGFGASVAGMLDYRLKQSFPEQTVEVINTALSAVNSYTLLDFTDEIIAQQPDAVLIYAGHNEYLGILGVGSAYTAANSQAMTLLYLKLKDVRLFQLMQQLYARFSTTDATATQQQSRTIMASVAKHKAIALDSDLYQQGLRQFETNMQLLLQKYQAAGIPVVISTVASNLADQPPFSSAELPAAQQQQLNAFVQHPAPDAAQVNAITELAASYHSADAYYALGRHLLAANQPDQAKAAFILAKDHDLLRFRAPEAINAIIRQLAAKAANVTLVDAEQALAAASSNGIIGAGLMLEHLHPNADGYFEIADSFYQVLADASIPARFPTLIPRQQAYREMPLLAAEHYVGKAKIAALVADYPFSKTPQTPKLPARQNWFDELGYTVHTKKLDWLTMANATLKQVQHSDKTELLKVAKLLSDAIPNDSNLSYQAGVILLQNGRATEAGRYLLRAIRHAPDNINPQLALSHALLEQSRFTEARQWLESVRQLQPDNPTAITVLRQLDQLNSQ